MKKQIKIAITGAAGQIGYALLFRIASGQMFGNNTGLHIRLLEKTAILDKLRGLVMEIEDCAFPLIETVKITDNAYEAFNDIDWAILIGSVPRTEGMQRSDLLKVNGPVFVSQGKALSERAKGTCKVLVVGNPCNTNAYIAKTVAKNIPEENFFALTMLDQNRAIAQIAKKTKKSISSIKNVAIWGNHSSTQYPDVYNAKIEGLSASEVIADEKWIQNDFLKTVQNRGSAIIKTRGSSSAASAANAIIATVNCLISPTPKGEFFSVAVSSDGSYGIPPGIVFSYPIVSDGINWRIVQGLKHNDFSQKKIQKTLQELLKEKEDIDSFI